jgi:hypothetical protein
VHTKWAVKAVIQKAISLLPDAQRANYLFQDRVTRSTTLKRTAYEQRLHWAGDHLAALRRLSPERSQGFTAVELGSGWYPIVPICLFLGGADRVWLVDLEDLGRDELAVQAVDAVLASVEDGEAADALGPVDPERVDRLRAAGASIAGRGRHAALGDLGLRVSPGDARTFDAAEEPDLICSNTVLEHIPATVLEGILARFRDLAGPGTVMSHLVDHCDHYAYVDPGLSVYHFLRYTDRTWSIIDNSIQPMNRLRASEYRAIYERLGIELTEEHLTAADGRNLIGEPLAERFRRMDPDDVACTASWLLTRFT